MENKNEKILRKFQGVVKSAKMKDTAVVEIVDVEIHPKYKKRIQISKRFSSHNPGNKFQEGDNVEIVACRPISKTKKWRIVKKIS
jgi:small subunit ribosomal protein S17